MWGFKRERTGLEKREKGRELAMRGGVVKYTKFQVEWVLAVFDYNDEGLFGTFEDIVGWALDEGFIDQGSFDTIVALREGIAEMQGKMS